MYGNDRRQLRRVFAEAWRKRLAGAPLDPMEQLIAGVIARHPEYHGLLSDADSLDRDWTIDQGESNPFLHLAMHLGLLEQIQTDRPAGIRGLHARLVERTGAPHEAEHWMMECLGSALWQAQRDAAPVDDQAYLDCLKGLLTSERMK